MLPRVENFMRKFFGLLLLVCASLTGAIPGGRRWPRDTDLDGRWTLCPGGNFRHRSMECRVAVWMDSYRRTAPDFLRADLSTQWMQFGFCSLSASEYSVWTGLQSPEPEVELRKLADE